MFPDSAHRLVNFGNLALCISFAENSPCILKWLFRLLQCNWRIHAPIRHLLFPAFPGSRCARDRSHPAAFKDVSDSAVYTTIRSIVSSRYHPSAESRTVMTDALNRTLFKWVILVRTLHFHVTLFPFQRILECIQTDRSLPYRFLSLLCTITSFTMSFSSSKDYF